MKDKKIRYLLSLTIWLTTLFSTSSLLDSTMAGMDETPKVIAELEGYRKEILAFIEKMDERLGSDRAATIALMEGLPERNEPWAARLAKERGGFLYLDWGSSLGVQRADRTPPHNAPRAYFQGHANTLKTLVDGFKSTRKVDANALAQVRSGRALLQARQETVEQAFFNCYLPGIRESLKMEKEADDAVQTWRSLPSKNDKQKEAKSAAWKKYQALKQKLDAHRDEVTKRCLGPVKEATAQYVFQVARTVPASDCEWKVVRRRSQETVRYDAAKSKIEYEYLDSQTTTDKESQKLALEQILRDKRFAEIALELGISTELKLSPPGLDITSKGETKVGASKSLSNEEIEQRTREFLVTREINLVKYRFAVKGSLALQAVWRVTETSDWVGTQCDGVGQAEERMYELAGPPANISFSNVFEVWERFDQTAPPKGRSWAEERVKGLVQEAIISGTASLPELPRPRPGVPPDVGRDN